MSIREKNFWEATVDSPAVAAASEIPDFVDVAVIGGGFCGLSAARTLAKRGVKVAVLEAETLGWGASSRNGGMVLTGMKLPVPALIKRYGREPARYVAGLVLATQRAGACLYDRTRVTSVQLDKNNGARKFRLQTSKGAITAREVILASGAYTSEATPALRKKIIPIGSYIIATEVLPADLARELSPRNRMIYDSKHFLYYYRLTPDNRMLFGGRAAFFPETENTVRQSAEILRRGMTGIYPQLRDAKVEFVWGGTLDFTLDVMPHAGKIDGMYFAAGFAGHGVATATWFGMKLAGLICGDPNDIPFEGIPFRGAPLGLRSGNTRGLPLAGP